MINLPKILLRIAAAAASGVLLSAGFPETDLSFLVWIGFVPLLLAVITLKPVYGYLLSHLTGMVFIIGVFDWILFVPGYTLLHHSLLVFYLGSYFGLLGLLFCFIARRSGPLMALVAVPFIWVALEYMRSNFFFLALPWGLLAHTQYQMPPVIQIAALTGAWGVSFLIVMVNAAIAALCLSFPKFRKDQNLPVIENTRFLPAIAAVLLITTLVYGYWTTSEPIEGQSYKLALVQGNIEQDKKWDKTYAKFIMETYTRLSIEASKSEPDMIVWPEAATPRAIYHDRRMFRDILNLAKSISTPLLFGSTNPQKFKRAGTKNLKFLNSTFLVPPDLKGQINQRYDKIRLFPFGEYLPYSNVIPWASINVPELTNYQAGKNGCMSCAVQTPEFPVLSIRAVI
jgi:apolipoprotein N-acyltransferase